MEDLRSQLQASSAAAGQYAGMDTRLREALLFIEDKESECSEAVKQVATLSNSVQVSSVQARGRVRCRCLFCAAAQPCFPPC